MKDRKDLGKPDNKSDFPHGDIIFVAGLVGHPLPVERLKKQLTIPASADIFKG